MTTPVTELDLFSVSRTFGTVWLEAVASRARATLKTGKSIPGCFAIFMNLRNPFVQRGFLESEHLG
jgi:hypothetical protein